MRGENNASIKRHCQRWRVWPRTMTQEEEEEEECRAVTLGRKFARITWIVNPSLSAHCKDHPSDKVTHIFLMGQEWGIQEL